MVFIEIDGKKCEARPGQMLIEVADSVGIPIPRFCYHKKLSVAANCRMCLVEVANAPKPLPACATPVTDGMKVFTTSPCARDAQKAVMEFLLINHPLDCPICDQGGQCELQDVALEYGKDVSRFSEQKRVVEDKNLGPLISTDMTRCIHCTRCVRFGTEIAGVRELGATGRGEAMQIGTYVEQTVTSGLSGNVIDLCPVGALTSKPFRFSARAWELQSLPGISPHDALGSNVFFHVFRGKVARTLPRENEMINEMWLSDRDRFGYEGFNHASRLQTPQIKRNGEWVEASWSDALAHAREKLSAIAPEKRAALASPNSTVEESYLLQQLWRAMGSSHVDHRLRQTDYTHQEYVGPAQLGISPSDLVSQEIIVLVGCDIQKEQPLLAHRIRQGSLSGAKIFSINPFAIEVPFVLEANWVGDSAECLQKNGAAIPLPSTLHKASVILGSYATMHPRAHEIYALSRQLAERLGATWGEISNGANSAGAWLAGALPHRLPGGKKDPQPGATVVEMWEQCSAFLLLHCEPEYDCASPGIANKALREAKAVVAITAFDNPHLREYADVLLPATPISEMAGTYVNAIGHWETFAPVVMPQGQARPAWKILRVLGNLFDFPEFNYESIDAVTKTVKACQGAPVSSAPLLTMPIVAPKAASADNAGDLVRLAPVALYSVDGIVRRAAALQATPEAQTDVVKINREEAKKRQLSRYQQVWVVQAGAKSALPLSVEIDDRLQNGMALVVSGTPASHTLGAPFGNITLQPVSEGNV